MQPQSPKSKKRGDDGNADNSIRSSSLIDTDISTRSSSLMDAMMTNLQLEEKLSAKHMLRRFLSIGSVVSTSSSFANRKQDAIGTRSQYYSIGSGTCGQVFEVPGTAHIFKLAKHPGQSSDMLWNDYTQHLKIQETFDKLGRSALQVRVPRAFYYVDVKDELWWKQNEDRFPHTVSNWTNILCAERILGIPRPLRESLIDEYCPKDNITIAKGLESNKHCLVRLYLGKRRTRVNTNFFSLRNFNLHLDQMEDLQLNTDDFAKAIAHALAIMHWACGLDANDIEFVLGSAPEMTADPRFIITKPLTSEQVSQMPKNSSTWDTHIKDFKKRQVHIWVLDFNRCKPFHPSDLKPLVNAFFINDPYYPRPGGATARDRGLWTLFREAYLSNSRTALQWSKKTGDWLELPGKFMDMVEEMQQQRRILASSGS